MKISVFLLFKKKSFLSQNIKYKSCLSPDNKKKIQTFFYFVSLISIQTQQHIKKGKKKPSPTFPSNQNSRRAKHCFPVNTTTTNRKYEYNFCEGWIEWIDVRILTSSSAPTLIIFTFIFWLIHFILNCMVRGLIWISSANDFD